MKPLILSLAILVGGCVPLATIPPLLITGGGIAVDADTKIDYAFSPGNPGRADRVKQDFIANGVRLNDKGRGRWTAEELAMWDAGIALHDRADAIRAAVPTIKAKFTTMTSRQIWDHDYDNDSDWPE
jgi:hypothetical protein